MTDFLYAIALRRDSVCAVRFLFTQARTRVFSEVGRAWVSRSIIAPEQW